MPVSQPSEGGSSSIYDLSPAHGVITDDEHGAYVVIATWIMMCFLTLSVSIRILTRLIPIRILGVDDVVIGISMVKPRSISEFECFRKLICFIQVLAIAQSAVIHVAASNGLGQHIQSVSSGSYAIMAKAYYTADMLFLMTIYLAKMSLVLFIMRLTPSRRPICFCYGLMFGMTVWMLTTMGLLALQCPLPRPWESLGSESATCALDVRGLYYSMAAVDIMTDIAITATPAIIVWGVRISRRQRLTVIGVFGCRLAVCICSAQLLTSISGFAQSSDRSWEVVSLQVWRQLVQSLSIITACIPCLRPFLTSLESGLMDSSMDTTVGKTYRAGSGQQPNGSPEGSTALASFATAGRDAIILPRGRHGKLKNTWRGSQPLDIPTRPRCPEVLARKGPLMIEETDTVYAGPRNYSCTNVPSSKIPAASLRDILRHEDGYSERGRQSTDSINMLIASGSGGTQRIVQAGAIDAGCIKETREIVISVENQGLCLNDDA